MNPSEDEDRREGPRHAVITPVLCTRDDYSEFHAVSVDISAEGLRLRAATIARAGERLVCNVRGVGAVQTRVAWAGPCDFGVRVVGADPSPGEVARRLFAIARAQAPAPAVVRVARRVVPARTAVAVTLPDGACVPATILDLSASGVGLGLDAAVAVGAVIGVGRHRARVVRCREGGVGAAFDTPLDEGPLDGPSGC